MSTAARSQQDRQAPADVGAGGGAELPRLAGGQTSLAALAARPHIDGVTGTEITGVKPAW